MHANRGLIKTKAIMLGLIEKIRRAGVKVYINSLYPIQKFNEKKIGKKDKIEVVFFAMNVEMWNYQGVYDLLSKEKRFNCHIVLTGACQYPEEQRKQSLTNLRNYFRSKNINYIDFDEEGLGYDVKKLIDPDILFYPQPYGGQYVKRHNFRTFRYKLICYIPYGVSVLSDYDWVYNTSFHNLAWKLYYPFKMMKQRAERIQSNHARNVLVSGYPNLDYYLSDKSEDVWKIKDRSIKRLIWAPHYSIPSEGNWITRSNFLWMSNLMLQIAEQYRDRLQIAFKPHPWLKSRLYEQPEWGVEKTDSYYDQWSNLSNTFIASGFVDLFKTSDAMIHDSGSFTAEYLFVNKPVAFVTNDLQGLMEGHSEFGRSALNQHYIVGDENDIRNFIESVVLGENDVMFSQRNDFFENVLRPNTTGTTSQFIVDDIKKSLGVD